MKYNCIKCGRPAGKGRNYVTVKVPDSTIQLSLKICAECGEKLSSRIVNEIITWRRGE